MATISVLSSYSTNNSVPAIAKRAAKAKKVNLENQEMAPSLQPAANVIVKKQQFAKALPLSESIKSNLINNQQNIIINQKPKQQKTSPKLKLESGTVLTDIDLSKPSNAGKAVHQPLAVARRNARERNRVKQVNNGFAALRQHIPEEMAETFEAPVAAKSAAAQKKLSKVETLRMAVEYIRNLEDLLNIPNTPSKCNDQSFSFCDNSSFLETSSSPNSDCGKSYSSVIEDEHLNPNQSLSPQNIIPSTMQVIPSVTTINGIHYLRIPSDQEFVDVNDLNNFIILSTRADQSPGTQEEDNYHQFTVDPHAQHQQGPPILVYDQQHLPVNFQTNLVVNNNNLLAPAPMPLSSKFGGGQTLSVSPVPQLKLHEKHQQQQQIQNHNHQQQSHHPNVLNNSFGDKNAALIKNNFKLSVQGHVEDEVDYRIPVKRQRRVELNETVEEFVEVNKQIYMVSPQGGEVVLNHESLYDNYHEKMVMVKSEITDEDSDLEMLEHGITDENMMDAIDWWESEERSS